MRKLLDKIKSHPLFQTSVTVVIIFSSLLVGVSTYDVDETILRILFFSDWFVTIFFLVEFLISFFSDEGDTVLDPFCGSGTTIIAANEMNRVVIGMDQSKDAIELTNQRLENPVITRSRLLAKGYDDYENADKKIVEILSGIDILPVQRNSMIDCFYRLGYQESPLPIRIQREGEKLKDLIPKFEVASKKKNAKLAVLIVNQPIGQLKIKPNKNLPFGTILLDRGKKIME